MRTDSLPLAMVPDDGLASRPRSSSSVWASDRGEPCSIWMPEMRKKEVTCGIERLNQG